jgi:hypothetical protein
VKGVGWLVGCGVLVWVWLCGLRPGLGKSVLIFLGWSQAFGLYQNGILVALCTAARVRHGFMTSSSCTTPYHDAYLSESRCISAL